MNLWPMAVFVGIATVLLGPVLYRYRRYLVERFEPSRTLITLRTLTGVVVGIAMDEIYRNVIQLHEPLPFWAILMLVLAITVTYARQFYERHRAHKEHGFHVR